MQIIDGKIVMNRESLTIQAQAEQTYRRVVEDRPVLNSTTYANRPNGDRWTKEDTELFFRAIAQFGTDFTLVARLFPRAYICTCR